ARPSRAFYDQRVQSSEKISTRPLTSSPAKAFMPMRSWAVLSGLLVVSAVVPIWAGAGLTEGTHARSGPNSSVQGNITWLRPLAKPHVARATCAGRFFRGHVGHSP